MPCATSRRRHSHPLPDMLHRGALAKVRYGVGTYPSYLRTLRASTPRRGLEISSSCSFPPSRSVRLLPAPFSLDCNVPSQPCLCFPSIPSYLPFICDSVQCILSPLTSLTCPATSFHSFILRLCPSRSFSASSRSLLST